MPVLTNFNIPSSPTFIGLPFSTQPNVSSAKSKLFLAFISSTDPETSQPWCPDVRAALPSINAAFSAEDGLEVALIEVGQKDEWREPKNAFRTTWNISNIPALVRFERVDGQVQETGRLVEGEILNDSKLQSFITG